MVVKKGKSEFVWQNNRSLIWRVKARFTNNSMTVNSFSKSNYWHYWHENFISILAISREDGEDSNHHNHHRGHGNNHNSKVPFNGYNSEEYLDRLEPNGNIPVNKSDLGYSKRKYIFTMSLSLLFLKKYIEYNTPQYNIERYHRNLISLSFSFI